MADLLISKTFTALQQIPEQERFMLHSMDEDSDLDGADRAEELVNFLEAQAPGEWVGFLCNDSVGHVCLICDVYDPAWTTVLVSRPTWEKYQAQVEQAEQAYREKHACPH